MQNKLLAVQDEILEKIKKRPSSFKTLNKKWQEDRDLFRRIVTEVDPVLFRYATPEQANDPDIALPAVQGYWYNYIYLGEETKKNPDIVSSFLPHMYEPLKTTRLHINLLKNKTFLLKTISYLPQILNYAIRRHKDINFFAQDPQFIKKAVQLNWNVLLNALEYKSSRLDRLILKTIPTPVQKKHIDTKIALKKLDIHAMKRIKTLQNAQHLIAMRKKLQNKTLDLKKPILVMIYSRPDVKIADRFIDNSLTEIIARGNQVLFFEVGNIIELHQALSLVAEEIPKTKEINLLIAGHGNPESVRLASDKEKEKDGNSIYSQDFDKPLFANLFHQLNINKVFFESCLIGAGGKAKSNLANRLAAELRKTSRVYAPMNSFTRCSYSFQADGILDNVIYHKDISPVKTYIAPGRLTNKEWQYLQSDLCIIDLLWPDDNKK